MARKDIDLDDYSNFDIDAELSKLEDLNFGDTEKPKSGREATFNILKDAGKGAKESFKFNKENINSFINAAMPSSLRGEYYDSYNAIFGTGGIKEALDTGLKDVKKSAKAMSDSLKGVLPKEGKLSKVLDKINKKLGLNEKTLEEQINNSNASLMETFRTELQNTFTKESSLALLQSSIQQKQFKSTLEVQNSINQHISVIRNFHLEVTNNYYRKSLELQYRSLLAGEGQLKALTEGFNLIKQQNEAIIKNTALPEFVKIKTSEQFKQVMLSNTATNIQNFLFKEISAIDKIKTSLSRRIKYGIENFMEGMNTVGSIADAKQMMDEMNSIGGPSKAFLAGNQIGNWSRDFLGKHVVDRLSNTKMGKRGVFNIKNVLADPGGWANDKLKNLRKNKSGNRGFLGKSRDWLLESFYSNVKDMASIGGDYVGTTFSRANPNDVAVFNNATQTSIVKIIPGLLSKIYGEVKTIRSGGGNPEDFELAFDYNRQTLVSKQDLKRNFLKDTSARLKHYTKSSIRDITDLYKEHGNFSDDELSAIGSSIISYVITSESRLNPSVIISREYLEHIPEGLKKKVLKAGKKILSDAIENPYIADTIIRALSGVRSKMPDMTTEIEMMYSTGNVPMLEEMGLLDRDNVNNSFSINRKNTLNMLRSASGANVRNQTIRSAQRQYDINSDHGYGFASGGTMEEVKKKFLYKPDGTKKTMSELREEYFHSEEYKQNLVKDFPEWLERNLGKSKGFLAVIKGIPTNLRETTNWVANKVKQQKQLGKAAEKFEDDIMDSIVGGEEKTLDELRTEFMESPEYQSGAVTKFPEWLDAQGLGPDGKRKKAHSRMWRLLQYTWALDRKMAKAMFKYPWKAAVGATKLAGSLGWKGAKWGVPKALKGAGYTAAALPMNLYYLMQEAITGKPATGGLPTWGFDRSFVRKSAKAPKATIGFMGKAGKLFSKIGKGIKRPFNWLFKSGVDAGVSTDTQTILAGLDEMNSNLSEMNANTPKRSFLDPEGDGLRKGDWRSRLKLFSKSKENKDGDKKNRGILNFMKENKGLTIMGGIMLVSGLLKGLNLSTEEVISGIKTVGRAIGGVVSAVKWVGEKIGSVIDGIGGFFGSKKKKLDENGNPVLDENGNVVYEDGVSGADAIGTVAAASVGLFAARHPIKATKAVVSLGKGLVDAVIKLCKSKFGFGWIGDMLSKDSTQIASKIDKGVGNFEKFKKYLAKLGRVVKNPKFIKTIGAKVAAKAAAKITTAIAAAFTGIGALLTAGMVLWELGWAIYYMWDKDISFWQGLMYQLFGTTLTDEEIDSYDTDKSNNIAANESGNLTQTITDKAGNSYKAEMNADGDVRLTNKDGESNTLYGYKLNRELDRYNIDREQLDDLMIAHMDKTQKILRDNNGSMSVKDFKSAWKDDPSYKGNTKVGDIAATSTRLTKSDGKCATGVRTILERAGYKSPHKLGYNVASAYMYAKPQLNGTTPLEGMGYSRLNVDPVGFRPKDGDVAVIDKGPMSNKEHGHIAVWSEKIKSWVSDFIQPDKSDPSPYGKRGLKARVNPTAYRQYVSLWRDVGNKTTGIEQANKAIQNETMPDQKTDGGKQEDKGILASTWDSVTNWWNGNDKGKEGMGAGTDVSSPMDMINSNPNNTGIQSAGTISTKVMESELNIISDTLIKSLKVQMHMAEALDKLANSDRSLNVDPNTIGKNIEKNKATEIGGTIPPSAINLQRNQYLMPI